MTHAARLHEHGKPLSVDEVSLEAPAAGEVEVTMAFGGVNPVDRYVAEGKVAPDGPLPRTLGGEGSGYLDGRPVLVAGGGLGAARDGLYAGRAIVPSTSVIDLPDGVDMRDAAAMGVAGLTAWNVCGLARVSAEDRVLVLGATGGVGLPIVSLAASIGATVWGQTATASKAAAVREVGAAHVVVCTAGELASEAQGLAPTVVIDSLGGAFTAAALALLEPWGRLVVFGTTTGPSVTFNLQGVYRNNQEILGYGGNQLSDADRREGLIAALGALADGGLRIVVDRVVPLSSVNSAFALLSDRAVTGKVLLDLS